MNAVQQYIADAFAAAQSVIGQQVTYTRNSQWMKTCAIAGTSTFEVVDADGTLIQFQSKDWLINTCDLHLADEPITPKRGDTITEVVGDRMHVYEVSRPDGSEQVYRFSDHGRTVVRIHTKLKETVAR